ncbi:hypothetical protein CHLNCDRAFT_140889 [Chlorella variabilis]|uniref:Rho-GAP domain-containing protein n=1 Tax=Chlorella variabilis TaxID=554065 RepID=E1Z6G1_CHLVA|nr:hypothetical protein CHLNCDRAFT_140889 [Chlorella variabilis]EFN58643.1 hypothetical protein CHLNCDRAFT_140889 [Chlorella variabilis]|eukprot:XP_005850745.1 hypothetical protein CHLNCDRAFT_140889 [Chlorella variabilis]
MQAQRAFGVALKDLAAAGSAPVVLQDCLRWLALRGLTTQRLFQTAPAGDKRKLLALRHLYDTGRRPLRSKSCRDKDPYLIANLLLLWLGSLPEPLFPASLVPALVESQQSDYYEDRVSAVRALLKQAEPFVVEALFPLFELLHHYWINQADRDGSLQELARLLAPAVFGTPAEHGLLAEDGGLLSDTVEMLISEYRPLFTQPFNLRRYEADAARQAAAEAQRAEAAAAASPPLPASPLLTPIRCQRLSVMGPEGDSPFSDCCGTPLPPDSPFSAYVAADGAAASPPFGGFRGPSLEGGGAAAPHPASAAAPAYDDDQHLEQTFSDLLECTVSGMLFDVPPTPPRGAHGDGEACYGSAPLAGGVLMGDTELACAGDQPMSPVAVLRDGGDESTDGSDCDAPLASQLPFAWPRTAARTIPATC